MNKDEINENNKENTLINPKDNEENIEQFDTDKIEYTTKEKSIYILKGIGSILSSKFHLFGYFSILSLGYTSIYLISFRRHYNQNLNFSYTYCLIPLVSISFSLTSPLSGFIKNKFNGKNIIIITDAILCLSFIIMYFSRSIYLDYILMTLNGFGLAIGFNITKINAISFFPNKKSLIFGLINLFLNFLSFILIMYNEVFILNNKPEYPSVDKIYYKESVFMNYQNLIIFEICLLIFACLFSYLLFFQNNPKETIKFGFNEKIKEEEGNKIDELEKDSKVKNKKNKIKKAIYDKRTIKLIIMIFLFFPTINLITNILRMDQHFYFIFGGLYNIVGCLSCLIFGILGNYIQFRILFIFLSGLLSLTSIFYVIYFDGEFILFLETILVSLVYNGFNIIFDTHIVNVHGVDNFVEMWGYIRSSEGISHIFGIILNCFLEINSPKYKIVYSITCLSSLISLGIGLFETEDKFNYDNLK